jgi:uncharacterized protein
MRALLDVNTLIALTDSSHTASDKAQAWYVSHAGGIATCAITINGAVRILSQPAYSPTLRYSTTSAIRAVRRFCEAIDHQFWHQDVSLVDQQAFDDTQFLGPKQITDAYLLAVAVKNDGVFVTFDAGVSVHAVCGARARHLLVL